MTLTAAAHQDETAIRYLPRASVLAHCARLDPCAIVADAFAAHAHGRAEVAAEAYLGWTAPDGAPARSLAMPGVIVGDGARRLGVKLINGSLGNPGRGLARAQGLVLLFNELTGRIEWVLEAAHISATRTAAVTMVTAQALCATPPTGLAVLGCGELARAHLDLAARALPSIERVRLMDRDPARAAALAAELDEIGRWPVEPHDDPVDCVAGAELVVTCTNTDRGYLPLGALSPGTLVAHVSLDDVLPEVVCGADLVLVDDWGLVAADRRRLFGRMIAAGELVGPTEAAVRPGVARVQATIGDVLVGRHPGRVRATDIVLSNPFGMGILDLALASAIVESAAAGGPEGAESGSCRCERNYPSAADQPMWSLCHETTSGPPRFTSAKVC